MMFSKPLSICFCHARGYMLSDMLYTVHVVRRSLDPGCISTSRYPLSTRPASSPSCGKPSHDMPTSRCTSAKHVRGTARARNPRDSLKTPECASPAGSREPLLHGEPGPPQLPSKAWWSWAAPITIAAKFAQRLQEQDRLLLRIPRVPELPSAWAPSALLHSTPQHVLATNPTAGRHRRLRCQARCRHPALPGKAAGGR